MNFCDERCFKPRAGDYAIAVVMACLSIWLLAWTAGRPDSGSRLARLYQNGQLIREIDLRVDGVTVQSAGGSGMTLEVKNGRIRVAGSDCARGICRHAGWVSAAGESIICIPSKVVIEISDRAGDSGYNAVTY